MPNFKIEFVAPTFTEGESSGVAQLRITWDAPVSAETELKWEILFKGFLPTNSDDYDALTGTVIVPQGAPRNMLVNIPIADDEIGEPTKEIVVRLSEGDGNTNTQDTIEPSEASAVLKDDDPFPQASPHILGGGGNDNVLTLGSSAAGRAEGAAGEDTYIVTRYQSGEVIISDSGVNTLKLDNGVEVAGWVVGRNTGLLTLASGEVVRVPVVSSWQFQIGDGEILTLDEFEAAIGVPADPSDPFVPYIVETYLPAEVGEGHDTNSLIVGTASQDVFTVGEDGPSILHGFVGIDTYVITRFQSAEVIILEVALNTLKLDVGLEVAGWVVSRNAGTLTLASGEIVRVPVVSEWQFQIGDGEILTPDAFIDAIRVPNATDPNTLEPPSFGNVFTVPFPDSEPPVAPSNNVPTLTGNNLDAIFVKDAAGTVDLSGSFTDVDGDTLTFSSSNLPTGFTLDSVTGVLSSTPGTAGLFEDIVVTATDRSGASVDYTFDIRVSDPSNNDPTLTGTNLDAIFVKDAAGTVDLSGSFTDADAGDTLTFSSSNLPTGFTLDSATGVLSSTPGTVGLFEDIVVTATDESGGTVDYIFDISVSIAEDPTYYFAWTPTGTSVGGVTIKKGSLDRYTVSDDAFSPTPDDANDILSGDNVVRLGSTFTDDADGETISLGGGADLYRVEDGFRANNVIIDDRSAINDDGANVIQFLSDVTIKGYEVVEVEVDIPGDESATLRSLYLQIDTDATAAENLVLLKIETPKTQFYQVGAATETLLTYDDFLAGLTEIDIPDVGSNDAPVVGTAIESQSGVEGQEKIIDLSTLFSDIDTGDTLTLSVVVELDGNEVVFDGSSNIISILSKELRITLASTGTYTVTVVADDGNGGTVSSSFSLEVVADTPPVIGIPGSEDRSGVGAVTEDGTLTATGVLEVTDIDNPPTLPAIELDGDGVGTYGTMTFDGRSWTYTLAVTPEQGGETQALNEGQIETETFTFRAGVARFEVTITVTGVNDVPVVGTAITNKTGTINQPIAEINLSDAFTDADENDTLTLALTVTLDGNAVNLTTNGTTTTLGTTGLTYNSETHILSGSPSAIGTYKIKIVATDSTGASSAETEFDIVITPQTITGDDTGSVTDGGAPGDDNTGELTVPGSTITLDDGNGTYGVMTFDGTTWTYTLDDRVEVLAEGQMATESFTFSAGGGTFEVTITITGANDAPTVSGEFFTRVGPTGGQFILTNLSDRFTDVDEGDELTFTVTLDDGAALSTIGLTYDSDEDEITGALTEVGTYVIKIVADDGNGGTVEATFDLEILLAVPIIQRNSLTYNPDETGSITIDETVLEVTSRYESDPTLLVYTITTLPDAGVLSKSGTPLTNGDTFTQADINNGLMTYEPSVSDPSTSQSNPLSFTFSDGVADLEEQTLQITSREVFEDADADEDNLIDRSGEIVPQKIEAGDGSDDITGSRRDDQIDGGAGDDEIKLTRTVNNVEEDAGADEVLYTFGYDGVGIDGGDEIVGFKRGQDKLIFIVDRNFNSLTEFLQSLNGADGEDLTADDAFIVTMQWGTDEDGAFYFDSVLLHFKDATAFGGGRVSSPLVQITFDQRLDLNDLVEIVGGVENVAIILGGGLAAFKNLDEVLPRLFGEGSIGFKGVAPSGTNGASERASEEPLEPPIYETLSEQHGDDLQPTSFELGGGETDII